MKVLLKMFTTHTSRKKSHGWVVLGSPIKTQYPNQYGQMMHQGHPSVPRPRGKSIYNIQVARMPRLRGWCTSGGGPVVS